MQKTILKISYFIVIFFLTITGFGKMPIFKRYYIADIPGLEWLANFYTTRFLHYALALILFSIAFYILFDIFMNKKKIELPSSVYAKLVMLLVLMITGILMTIKNFTGTPFSPNVVIALDLTHTLFCIILLVYSLHTFLTKQKGIMHYFSN